MSGRGCVLDVCLFVCWQWLGASVLAFWFDLISMAWGCQQSSLSVTPSSKAKTVASFDIIATPIMVGWQLAPGSWLACLTGQCGAWLQFVQLVVIYLTRPTSSVPTVGACHSIGAAGMFGGAIARHASPDTPTGATEGQTTAGAPSVR